MTRELALAILLIAGCRAGAGAGVVSAVEPPTDPELEGSADCPPAGETDTDSLDFGAIVVKPLAPAGDRWSSVVCPTGAVKMARVIGVGVSDIAEVTEVICERGDGVREGSYEARLGDTVVQRGRYAAGHRQGPWSITDFAGGRLEGSYVRGRRHGDWSSYHPRGKLAWRGRFRCGAREGDFTWWYLDGTLLQRGRFARDVPDGPWHYFWPNGGRKSSGNFVAGEKKGSWSYWDEAGTPLPDGPPLLRQPDSE